MIFTQVKAWRELTAKSLNGADPGEAAARRATDAFRAHVALRALDEEAQTAAQVAVGETVARRRVVERDEYELLRERVDLEDRVGVRRDAVDAAVAADDGLISNNELTLVKAIAAVMDCPMPDAMLAAHGIAVTVAD